MLRTGAKVHAHDNPPRLTSRAQWLGSPHHRHEGLHSHRTRSVTTASVVFDPARLEAGRPSCPTPRGSATPHLARNGSASAACPPNRSFRSQDSSDVAQVEAVDRDPDAAAWLPGSVAQDHCRPRAIRMSLRSMGSHLRSRAVKRVSNSAPGRTVGQPDELAQHVAPLRSGGMATRPGADRLRGPQDANQDQLRERARRISLLNTSPPPPDRKSERGSGAAQKRLLLRRAAHREIIPSSVRAPGESTCEALPHPLPRRHLSSTNQGQ